MSDSFIPVNNTPIFDELYAKWAAGGKRYENLVARTPIVNPWPKTMQGVRPSVQVADEIQTYNDKPLNLRKVAPENEQIVVRTLSGSMAVYGGVSAEEALENAAQGALLVKSIGEDIADSLYMPVPTWANHEE